eukprot:5629673-Alexandrium_andersonii.AAC.1
MRAGCVRQEPTPAELRASAATATRPKRKECNIPARGTGMKECGHPPRGEPQQPAAQRSARAGGVAAATRPSLKAPTQSKEC